MTTPTKEEAYIYERTAHCIQSLFLDFHVEDPDYKIQKLEPYISYKDRTLATPETPFVISNDNPTLDKKARSNAHKIWDDYLLARAKPRHASYKKFNEETKTQEVITKTSHEACPESKTQAPLIKTKRKTDTRLKQLNKRTLTQDQAAAKELAQRELSKRYLLPFVMRYTPGYQPGWVHKIICAELEKFEQDILAKKSPRLMIAMPPRAGKSQIASVCYPAWFMGRNPTLEIIAASYATSLSMGFSRKARGIIADPDFQNIFPGVGLDQDNKSAETWMTDKGGSYVAAGVTSGITGKGAHLGVIDDPIRDRVSADSEMARESVKDWYSSAFYTRLAPGGGVLCIQTRWHSDDLSGWLEDRMEDPDDPGADNWRIIKFPAIATEDEMYRKRGEALHPERYDEKQLAQIQNNMLPRDWSALYQQNPVADEGAYFRREFFRYYTRESLPNQQTMNIYSAVDLAIGQRTSNDYTVIVTVGVDEHDRLYLLNMVRARLDALQIVDLILTTYETYRPNLIGIERGQIELSIQPILEKRMRERNLYPPLEKLLPGRQDKEARARSIQGRMQQGMVYFPKDAGWLEILENELLQFPAGKFDDCVDSLAWIGLMLGSIVPPRRAKGKPHKTWKDRLSKFSMGKRYKSAMSA